MKSTHSLPSSPANAPAINTHSAVLVRDFIQAVLNRGDLSQLETFIHHAYHYFSPTEEIVGGDALRAFIQMLRTAFPDLNVQVKEQISEAHKVCTRVVMTGTQLGEFNGIPPTGRRIEIEGVIISQLEAGRIRQEWELLDQYALLQQLGLLPEESSA
ncbi:MAG: ester cyclase [Synoicihabitans sp.]